MSEECIICNTKRDDQLFFNNTWVCDPCIKRIEKRIERKNKIYDFIDKFKSFFS